MSKNSSEKIKSYKRKRIINIAVIVLLVLVNCGMGFGLRGASQIRPIKQQANGLKGDVKAVMADISGGHYTEARATAAKMKEDSAALRDAVSTRYWKIVQKMPVVGKQLTSAITLTEILDTVDDSIIVPMIDLLEGYPSDTIMVDGSLNGEVITAYVEFVDNTTPIINDVYARMTDLDVSLIDSDGKIAGYIEEFAVLSDVMTEASGRVIKPLAEQLKKYPTSEIKTESGYNNEALRSYLMFIDWILPEVKAVTTYIDSKDFSSFDSEGKIKEYASDVAALTDLLGNASENVIIPLIDQLEECPLDNIKADDGFNVVVVNEYLYFIEECMPGFKDVSEEMAALDLKRLDANGKITEYKEKLDHIITIYDDGEQYIPLIHALLGDGSDRFYFIGTQNSAEIRASGGFPGSVGTLEIKDGIMTIGDFQKVYDVFRYNVPREAEVTDQERRLFEGMPFPWDADFCPDFERVAKIWALAYEERNHKHVDGVISMTPSIIQELLVFLGDIELSDGTVLTGENATAFLQNGIYVKYENTLSEDNEGDKFVNALFAETAKKTMSLLVSEFKVGYMPEFLNVMQNGIEDRMLMFWFEDEKKQEIARNTGSNGGLSRDEVRPEAGIYFNLTNACKMGWYLDIDYECSDPVVNEDGSSTYDVSVTFTNIMTWAEASKVSGYISSGGYMNAKIYLFAPVGGQITDIEKDGRLSMIRDTYSGLDLACLAGILNAGNSATVKYKITTSTEADAPLRFSVTPTMTRYRQ